MPTDPTPTLPYFLPMEQGTTRAHCALVVPVSDEVSTEAEDARFALETLVHYYADLADREVADVIAELAASEAGSIPFADSPLVAELRKIPETIPVAIVNPGEDDPGGWAWVVVREDVAYLRDFGEDDGAALKFGALVTLTRDYATTVGDHFPGVLNSLAENLEPEPKAWPLRTESHLDDDQIVADLDAEDDPAPLDGRPASPVPNAVDLEVAAELADQADDRCGYCREVVDLEGPEGDALRRIHDDGLCRPSVHGSQIAAADELLRAAEALEGPRWTAALAEYLRVVGYLVGDRVAIGTDPRFVIVGTVVGVLDRDAGYIVRPANGNAVPVRRDELRPIVADLLASAGTVVDAAPAGSPS